MQAPEPKPAPAAIPNPATERAVDRLKNNPKRPPKAADKPPAPEGRHATLDDAKALLRADAADASVRHAVAINFLQGSIDVFNKAKNVDEKMKSLSMIVNAAIEVDRTNREVDGSANLLHTTSFINESFRVPLDDLFPEGEGQ